MGSLVTKLKPARLWSASSLRAELRNQLHLVPIDLQCIVADYLVPCVQSSGWTTTRASENLVHIFVPTTKTEHSFGEGFLEKDISNELYYTCCSLETAEGRRRLFAKRSKSWVISTDQLGRWLCVGLAYNLGAWINVFDCDDGGFCSRGDNWSKIINLPTVEWVVPHVGLFGVHIAAGPTRTSTCNGSLANSGTVYVLANPGCVLSAFNLKGEPLATVICDAANRWLTTRTDSTVSVHAPTRHFWLSAKSMYNPRLWELAEFSEQGQLLRVSSFYSPLTLSMFTIDPAGAHTYVILHSCTNGSGGVGFGNLDGRVFVFDLASGLELATYPFSGVDEIKMSTDKLIVVSRESVKDVFLRCLPFRSF